MIFAGIVKTSLLDYPGKIATVLFTPGCNYNCYYCQNRSLIEDFNYIVPNDEIEAFLERRVGLIDGVVITGGEPTLHPDLIPYLKKLKTMGYLTKVDTNGSNPEVIQSCIDENSVDYFSIDYKAPIDRYAEICRGESDPDKVLESINLLLRAQKQFEVRTTVIPQLTLADLITMAEELPKVPRYVLNPYNKPIEYLESDQVLIDEPPYSETQIAEFAATVKLYQPNVILVF